MSENWKLRFVLCKSKNRIGGEAEPQARQADRREAYGKQGLVRTGGKSLKSLGHIGGWEASWGVILELSENAHISSTNKH